MLSTKSSKGRRDTSKHREVIVIDPMNSEEDFHQLPRKIVKKNLISTNSEPNNDYSNIEEAPTVYLTNEDMKGDPVKYFIAYEEKYKQYGAVKLVASPDWNPPFCFKFTDRPITTRLQQIHKLWKGKAFTEREEAYNIKSFTFMAEEFEKNYKYRSNPSGETKQHKNEKQYWHIISNPNYKEDPKLKVTVEYAADLPAVKFGSGFPQSESRKSKDENFDYANNLFNLNNIYKSSSSILKIAQDKKEFISGVTSPWVYMGMQFSTFCWHVEDMWLNSLNYSHKGAVKTWYVVPASDKQKFDQYVRKKTSDDQLLDKITFMLDPLQLKKAGIKVYKINQHPKEYVCTFFKAYHCGFSHGFNIGQAVNFASPYSLGYMKEAIQYYSRKKCKKPLVMPLQWLIYSNKIKGQKFGPFTSLMDSEYKQMLEQERQEIRWAIKKCNIGKVKQFPNLNKYDKSACTLCRKYLYLWYLKCQTCEKTYCLKHAQSCCGDLTLYLRQVREDRKSLKKILNGK